MTTLETDGYAKSFSWEWRKHQATLVDSVSGGSLAHDMFTERTGLTPADVHGKLVLDAGCGTGRFMEVVKDLGGYPVGIDLSHSVEYAAQLVPSALVVHGDILTPPFKHGTFDIVFSIGVLHHTPDAHGALKSLAQLVKPGGLLAVWLYSDEGRQTRVFNRVSGVYRIMTTRLPMPVLYWLCALAFPASQISRIPIVGNYASLLFPCSVSRDRRLQVLETFDWYSPKYQSKHTYQQVTGWFKDMGFVNIERLPFPVSVRGIRL